MYLELKKILQFLQRKRLNILSSVINSRARRFNVLSIIIILIPPTIRLYLAKNSNGTAKGRFHSTTQNYTLCST